MEDNRSEFVTDQAATFGDYLRREMPSCFAELDPSQFRIEFAGKWQRPASIIYRYWIGDSSKKKHVLIKVPLRRGKQASPPNGGQPAHVRRPNLVNKTASDVKFQLEYEALSLIQRHFQRLDEARFDVIRVLDFLPDYRAIVMEESQYPSLRDLFSKTSRLHIVGAPKDLGAAFRNTGGWLRRYHHLPLPENAELRQASRADVVEALQGFVDYLVYANGQQNFFENLGARAIAVAGERFPEKMPLGLGHGDFAMRNILVGPGVRVTVFDTLAKWQTPIYEDMAYFLVGLKSAWPQAFSQGMLFSQVRMADYEHEFLQGYFEPDPIPMAEIRLYELLMLLDKWSYVVSDTKRLGKDVKKRFRLAMINRYYRRYALQLLDEIDVSAMRSANIASA